MLSLSDSIQTEWVGCVPTEHQLDNLDSFYIELVFKNYLVSINL